jgi:peptidoglycan/xylan/chitin deacetylase (PgdA/CDA1 family)
MLTIVPLRIYKKFGNNRFFSFFYHVVSSKPLPHIIHLYPQRPIELFENDLGYLANHFEILSYNDIEQGKHQKSIKDCAFLSFDDGFSECYTIVRPLLLKFGIPCTFFLATDFIDNRGMYYRNKLSILLDRFNRISSNETVELIEEIGRLCNRIFVNRDDFIRWLKSTSDDASIDQICDLIGVNISQYLAENKPYLTTDQIRTLIHDGFSFGAHSKSHHKLGTLAPSLVETEILESCQFVKEITGQNKIPFSFPNSGEGLSRDYLKSLMESHPYVGLFFDTKGIRRDREYVLNRIWVEAPKFNPGGNKSLPDVLKLAYQENAIKTIISRRTRDIGDSKTTQVGTQESTESPTMVD